MATLPVRVSVAASISSMTSSAQRATYNVDPTSAMPRESASSGSPTGSSSFAGEVEHAQLPRAPQGRLPRDEDVLARVVHHHAVNGPQGDRRSGATARRE